MYTKEQAYAIIKSAIGQDPKYLEQLDRVGYTFNPTTKLAQSLNEGANNNTLAGYLSGTFETVTTNESGIVVLVMNASYGTYKYSITYTILPNYTMAQHSGLFVKQFTDNLVAIKNSGIFAKAQAECGLTTDEEVIHYMATMTSTYKLDIPQINPADYTVSISHTPTNNGSVLFSCSLLKNGQEESFDSVRWEVWPQGVPQGVPNTKSNRDASSQFPTGDSFELTTNISKRDAYQVLSPNVKINCAITLVEDDGDNVVIKGSVTTDLSQYLPTYNYFGL
jgi:hypothetical protein